MLVYVVVSEDETSEASIENVCRDETKAQFLLNDVRDRWLAAFAKLQSPEYSDLMVDEQENQFTILNGDGDVKARGYIQVMPVIE